MPQLSPVSVKQARITLSGSNTPFTSISGGKYSREDIKYSDGNVGIEKTFVGMVSIEALTLTRPYDPTAEKEIVAFVNSQRTAQQGFTVTVQPVSADVAGTAVGTGVTYTGCVLVSYTPAKFDRNGNGLAMTELVIQPTNLPTYG